MLLSDAVDKLRGKVGSDVTVTIQRAQNEPFDVTATRDTIKIRSVRSDVFDNIDICVSQRSPNKPVPG